MRILVTGGDGFIGKHIASHFRGKGHDVVILDLPYDIVKRETCWLWVNRCDVILHLAAFVGVAESFEDPTRCLMTNVVGTQNLVHAAEHCNIKRIIAASTAGAMVNSGSFMMHEANVAHPLSPYGASKLAMEGVLFSSKLSTCCLRLSNVYGPGCEHKPNLIPRAFRAIRTDAPLTVYGDGFQTRDYVYVDDVVDAFDRALSSDIEGLVNIASGKSYSVHKVLERVAGVVGRDCSKVKYKPIRGREPKQVVINNGEALRLLGWKPKVGLREGLAVLWKHMQEEKARALAGCVDSEERKDIEWAFGNEATEASRKNLPEAGPPSA